MINTTKLQIPVFENEPRTRRYFIAEIEFHCPQAVQNVKKCKQQNSPFPFTAFSDAQFQSGRTCANKLRRATTITYSFQALLGHTCSQMRPARTFLISCGGEQDPDSIAVRSDNLATTATFEGSRTAPSKHFTAICAPFILQIMQDRTKRLFSSHIRALIPRGETVLPADISCLHATPDYVIAGSDDGKLRVWRATDGELVIEQHLHIGALTKVYLDESLWVVFAASATGQVGAWPLPSLFTSAEPDHVWSIHSLKVTDFVVSSGCRVFSVSHDKTAKCFDFCAKCEIKSANFPTALSCCALAHSESVLYCGGVDGNVYRVMLTQDFPIDGVIEGHTMEITDLLLSDDDRSLYTASLDMTVRRVETATGQTTNHIQTAGVPFALTWIPDLPEVGATPVQEGRRRSRKGGMSNNHNVKRGFPKLTRSINGNREELVSAPVEDIDILSADDELMIAMVDLCNQQVMVPQSCVEEEKEKPATQEEPVQEENIDELTELKRQNALMYQYILSKQSE